jgi:hypothetical protein
VNNAKPVGQCPRCGANIWDLSKWVADGKAHPDCLGSDHARLAAERDLLRAENARLRDAAVSLWSVLRDALFKVETSPGFMARMAGEVAEHEWLDEKVTP